MNSAFLQTQDILNVGWSIGIILVALGGAWVLYLGLNRVAKRAGATALTGRILGRIAGPVALLVIIQGIYLALNFFTPLRQRQDLFQQINRVLIIVLGTYTLARVGYVLVSWYAPTIAVRTETTLDDTFTPLVRRLLVLTIYAIGALILLDTMGVSIAPMLTGLGLSGLAVALALQPTLANFFAGLQVITDQVVSVGDFVELDSGVQGYVVEVGWRSTRIRSTYQNLIVVPNSRLVDSIITNYDTPLQEVAVIVEAGVSYSSDLGRVEEIAMDVTRQVIQELPEAVKDREPWFGFDTFGDSNISFWVWHYATDYIATFRLKSELIKRLHARFNQEGIEINYPVRKLVYEHMPQAAVK
jgi:small-conductance mechanosensitive channel